ncbi:hypothetical protein [Hirschia baltica]|uniref:Uncharacterized protein n=1 Tax=Hirschia baltica (strain ATCC 49814 / DSM 5838 / IFAM 1418) TaxID=582402 RepID=C6XL66_HIRBI|nr:hypothetical protein [Hirschia baltica]ACT57895.1 hypothetical protein Hbal_0193 [Hirschia baltica ATCC 49814]
MMKFYIAMVLLYGGVLFSGISGHSLWTIPIFSGIFLLYMHRSRPRLLENAIGVLGVWSVQIILAAIVYAMGWGVGRFFSVDIQISPLIPILMSASAVAYAYLFKLPTADDFDKLNTLLEEAIDEIEAINIDKDED